jgi:hypothetical protein
MSVSRDHPTRLRVRVDSADIPGWLDVDIGKDSSMVCTLIPIA